VDLLVVQHVFGRLGITLLRVVPARPGAPRPSRRDLNLGRRMQQLAANALKASRQRSSAGGIQLGQPSTRTTYEVDARLVIRIGGHRLSKLWDSMCRRCPQGMTKSHARILTKCHTVPSQTREGRRTCLRQAVTRYFFHACSGCAPGTCPALVALAALSCPAAAQLPADHG